MSSPVTIPYQRFLSIDRMSSTAVYLQISHQLINAIQRGYVPAGSKLPGTRTLSELLQVHRKTIVAVYEELDALGWVQTVPNKGTFVISINEDKKERLTIKSSRTLRGYPKETGFSFKKSNILDNPFEYSTCRLFFNDGTPDIRLTQIDQLSRFYSANLKRKSNQRKLGYYNQEGSEYFKQQLSYYLNLSRGLHISNQNLLITRSTEMSMYIVSEIILQPNDIVVITDLSYFSVNMIFQKTGARLMTIPVDKNGLVVDALEALCKKYPIRMLYVTPHHHYPTTVTLSAERRIRLLDLAHQYGFIIIEDDYDYDFHYDKRAVLPLASADENGMVIYIGSFGKSLAPGFRTGFVVAPENIMIEMRKYLGVIDRQGDILMEQALGEMIEDGEINRHLKKSVKIYENRRNTFVQLLNNYLEDAVQFDVPSGGLAIWLEWLNPVNLVKLSSLCLKENIFIPRTLLYQNSKLTAMRLGFGHLNENEMHQVLNVLKRAYDHLKI